MNSLRASLLLAAAIALAGCNAYRAFFPSSHHDETPPELPAGLERPAVLVFSKTNGFRHDEAIPAGIGLFKEIAARRGWGIFATENGAVHDADLLSRFDAVVWLQVSGDVLDDTQRAALLAWLEAGGGFVGIHGTGGDASYAWSEHPGTLVGAQFIGHPLGPQLQEATIVVEDREHPATRHLPETWVRTDEWYSFAESPRARGVRVLATLDERTYSPRFKLLFMDRDLAMGDEHPIVWNHCAGEGRVFYSAIGHLASAFAEPAHATLLEEATAWAMGLYPDDCASIRIRARSSGAEKNGE